MSKIIPVYKNNLVNNSAKISESAIQIAKELLLKDKIIAVPTDTIYGIAGNVQCNKVINKIYEIKQRDLAKPIAICLPDIDSIYKWSEVTVKRKVLEDLLPGPVTVVFKRAIMLNPNLNPNTKLIGIRIPDEGFIKILTKHCSPLALTSANRSSAASANSIDEFKDIWNELDAIFDAGIIKCSDPNKLGSTVVDLSEQGFYRIIRVGCALNEVDNVLQRKYSLVKLD